MPGEKKEEKTWINWKMIMMMIIITEQEQTVNE